MGMTGRTRFGGFFSSFGARIFWSTVPIVALFLMVQSWMNVREQNRLATAEFIKRGEAIVAHLASSSELGVFSEDTQLLAASIRGAVKDPDVAYVVIQAEDGRVLADGGREAATVAGQFDKRLAPPRRVQERRARERTGHRVRRPHHGRGGEDARRHPDRRPAGTWPGGEGERRG